MRAFGSEPRTAHTTLAVLCRPLAKGFEKPSRIHRTRPFCQPTEADWLSWKGEVTTLAGFTEYHQTLLKGTDGQRVTTPAAELA